jgi:ubiquinone biosynthesis protein UbiJ
MSKYIDISVAKEPVRKPDKGASNVTEAQVEEWKTAVDRAPLASRLHEHAELGAAMAEAGLTSQEVRALIGIVEQAAIRVATSLIPTFMNLARETHVAACREIERRIRAQHSVLGFNTHPRCVEITREVADSVPKHV